MENEEKIDMNKVNRAVPDVSQMALETAYQVLEDHKIKFNKKHTKRIISFNTKRGYVVRTEPSKNTDIDPEEEVIVYQSSFELLPLLLIVLLLLIISLILLFNFARNKKIVDDNNITSYQGKDVYVDENGNKIIVSKDDSGKTIEEKENNEYKSVDEQTKKKFTISNINISYDNTSTIIKGHIKNDSSNLSDIFVSIKFKDDSQIVASASVHLSDLGYKKEKDFEVKILGDYTNYSYDTYVEFAK